MKICKECLEKVRELIDKDREYQKSHLVKNFERDKPIYWRLIGWDWLLTCLEEEK